MILEHARQREDVAHVVVDHEHPLAREHRVGVVQPLEHPALLLRQLRLHAVQEQRGLVEQPLRRLHILHDDRLRELPQLRLLRRREILARVDDDRQVPHRGVRLHGLQQLEAVHVLEAQVEHHAVEVAGRQLAQRIFGRSDRRDLDVLVLNQLDHARALRLVVLDDEQPLHRRSR